ncbi:23S rRNA (adenine(2030)-N(6))-methyltransferase RlmJ [Puniceibacterium sp. IMCC21224]|uniref:23S rRNA (adenine(2030)-N(6))-methyltransferase RlmJ n=1 Tax=Puniceibacterium sp. IMCC21224 TaxID=1618204 RepID=UPI00064D867B|nr:23S rRNA (adenine(2030)-N(6))-methyltransferase RlmJ [Puniceibacterium sp. IMCC21224]KMK66811.1 protein involved in catabolism of external DNA [Puniceibacterium sp. IMCC21224]
MLSYQHHYHAGNLADVHKHALLAWMLDYLTQKPKPLSYIETHAGRGLYDLSAPEAMRTGEAAKGILRADQWFAPAHPYARALAALRQDHGPDAYPGSPMIAATLLRAQDRLHLAELHPGEHAALKSALDRKNIHIHHQDGFALAQSLCPPEPRRGLLLIDPSYEIKSDYADLPRILTTLHRKWNVGILVLWYPILTSGAHHPMLDALSAAHPTTLRHEVSFPPVRDGHRMVGSGMFIINPPYGTDAQAAILSGHFARLS